MRYDQTLSLLYHPPVRGNDEKARQNTEAADTEELISKDFSKNRVSNIVKVEKRVSK